MSERLRLGDMLVAAGLVTDAQVREALSAQRDLGLRLGETLVQLGYVTEAKVIQVVSNQLSIPWVNLHHVDFSRELLDRVPAELAEAHRLVPVYVRHVRRQGDTLYVAMDDPMDVEALQRVAERAGLPTKPMVAAPTDIENAIRVYYLGLEPLADEIDEADTDTRLILVDDDAELADDEVTDEEAPTTRRAAVPRQPESERPKRAPSPSPRPARAGGGFRTLTLLDGTVVRLPGVQKKRKNEEERAEHGLTTRDLIHALRARAAGEDVSEVLPDGAWEPLFATLLSVLLRKGLIADWEFVDEWKKQTRKRRR